MQVFRSRNTDKHDLGYWVETREDALKEAYHLKNWYGLADKTAIADAFRVMEVLCQDLDTPKEEVYVDPEYKSKA